MAMPRDKTENDVLVITYLLLHPIATSVPAVLEPDYRAKRGHHSQAAIAIGPYPSHPVTRLSQAQVQPVVAFVGSRKLKCAIAIPVPVLVLHTVDEAQRQAALDLRRCVFVVEQGVSPEVEHDVHDRGASHVLATLDGEVVGAARYREADDGIKLERVAVMAARRRQGIGTALVKHIMAALPAGANVYLHAQSSAIDFWSGLGFQVEGEPFMEANISHRRMRLHQGQT